MQTWELAVLIIALAFAGLSVYLIMTLIKLKATIESLDKMLLENTENINEIMKNVSQITADTKNITDKANKTVENISSKANTVVNSKPVNGIVQNGANIRTIMSITSAVLVGAKVLNNIMETNKLKKSIKLAKKQARS